MEEPFLIISNYFLNNLITGNAVEDDVEGLFNQRNHVILEYNLYKFTHKISSCCSASSALFSFSW